MAAMRKFGFLIRACPSAVGDTAAQWQRQPTRPRSGRRGDRRAQADWPAKGSVGRLKPPTALRAARGYPLQKGCSRNGQKPPLPHRHACARPRSPCERVARRSDAQGGPEALWFAQCHAAPRASFVAASRAKVSKRNRRLHGAEPRIDWT